jgi:hypothetical protein
MKYTIALFSTLLLFGSCRKDKTEPFPDTAPLPLSESASQILIGDSTGMKIKTVNYTLTYAAYGTNELNIPIWYQDTNDFRATSLINHGPGPWMSTGLTLESNSTVEFVQAENGFITYEVLDTQFNNTNPVYEVYTEGYTCNESQSNGTIYGMKDQLLYLDEGEMISIDDYSSAFAQVVRASTFSQPYFDETNPDTTIVHDQTALVSCNNLALNTEAHIGIIMEVEGIKKLGWMKFTTGNGLAINISEIAIQR